MKFTFDKAFEHVVGLEGGYVDDLKDPGGRTKFGISQRAYPSEDIKNLTLDRAKFLYRRDYWDKIKGDQLPSPLNYLVFDAAVNQGVKTASTMLQSALNVGADGVIGQITIKAAQNANAEVPAIFMAKRAVRYTNTAGYDRFGDGWLKRLFLVMQHTA